MKKYRRPHRYRQFKSTAKAVHRPAKGIKTYVFYGLLLFVLCSVSLVVILRFAQPPTTAFMLLAHFEDFTEGKGYLPIEYQWVDAGKISKYAFTAVIASEDQQFYRHNGFDLQAIGKALKHYAAGGKLHGASTISQQVAKNLFLSPSKTVARKVLESWFTLLIEAIWGKPRILEMYLNIAEFGDHLFGVEAASHRYFGVPARQLSAKQAALLAASLPNPLVFKVDHPGAYLFKRQAWIIGQMRNF